MKGTLFLIASFYFLAQVNAQNIAINNDGTMPDPKAMLDVKSTTKGVLLPRMSESDRVNMTGNIPLGLIVFQTDGDRGLYCNSSSVPTSPSWRKMIGNADQYWFKSGTNLYTNSDVTGNIGIGTATPANKFTVRYNGIGVTQESTDGNTQIGFFTTAGSAYLQTHTFTPLNFTTGNGTTQMQLSTNGTFGIGTVSPTLAGLVVDKRIGATNALFGSNTTGVAIETSYPGIGLNTYYNAGRKFISSGYGGLVGLNPVTGSLALYVSDGNGAANADAPLTEALTITNTGAVGIGISTPGAQLEASRDNPNIFQLSNTTALNTSVKATTYIKTGSYYTGIIETRGTSAAAASLAFKTFASTNPSSLQERLTIRNDGNVGVNSTNPATKLYVNGKSTFVQNTLLDDAAVEINGVVDIKGAIKVSGSNDRPAFQLTVNASNAVYSSNIISSIRIDNTLCDGDPNAMIFITPLEAEWLASVSYQTSDSKWYVKLYRPWQANIPLQSVRVTKCTSDFQNNSECEYVYSVQPINAGAFNYEYPRIGNKLNVMIVKQ